MQSEHPAWREIGIAVAIAGLSALATSLVEWACEEAKESIRARRTRDTNHDTTEA